ncbi:hypothetical protein TNCV_733961 [Trichonephila clavipes]|nr:hypothetical protein TNCV_733961 [Trichonephila clavipes]
MDKCLQMLDKELRRLGNRIRRAERDFGSLPKRRDGRELEEESPGWNGLEESPGWRELEESAKERDLVRDWSGKEGKDIEDIGRNSIGDI